MAKTTAEKKLKKQTKKLKKKTNELSKFLAKVKGSAMEGDVNVVHNLINQGVKIKIGSQVMLAKKAVSKGNYEDANFELDEKSLTMGIRWCNQNGTKATPDASMEISDKVDELKAIRDSQRGRTVKAVGDY